MSSVSPPVPPHASHTTRPPPKHSGHFVCTIPVPLQMSHSITPFSVVSLPVPLHSSHLAGMKPVPLHLPQLTSPLPLQLLHAKNQNPDLNQSVGRFTEPTRLLLLNLASKPEIFKITLSCLVSGERQRNHTVMTFGPFWPSSQPRSSALLVRSQSPDRSILKSKPSLVCRLWNWIHFQD